QTTCAEIEMGRPSEAYLTRAEGWRAGGSWVRGGCSDSLSGGGVTSQKIKPQRTRRTQRGKGAFLCVPCVLCGFLFLYCSKSSGAPCRRSNCGRFCENADRGMTTSHPASCAFCFSSPCTWETKPRMVVPFLNFDFSLGMMLSGLLFRLFRSTITSDGFSTSPILSNMSFSVLTNSTFTLSLRLIS